MYLDVAVALSVSTCISCILEELRCAASRRKLRGVACPHKRIRGTCTGSIYICMYITHYHTATQISKKTLKEELHMAVEKFSFATSEFFCLSWPSNLDGGPLPQPMANSGPASGSFVTSGQRLTRSLGRCHSTPRASLRPLQRARGSELHL